MGSKQVYHDREDRVFPVFKGSGARTLYFTGEKTNELLNSMKGVWDVEDFSQVEATVIMEVITAKTEMDGDYSGLEYVGRFPTGPEVAALNFSLTVPVWLRSGQDDRLSLVGSLVEKLRIMSDWMLDNYAEN